MNDEEAINIIQMRNEGLNSGEAVETKRINRFPRLKDKRIKKTWRLNVRDREESGMPQVSGWNKEADDDAIHPESESRWTGEHGNFCCDLPSLNPCE